MYSHWPIFTTLGEMTDIDKVMNPQHLWNNLDPNTDKSRNVDSNPESLPVEVRRPDGGLCSVSTVYLVINLKKNPLFV